MVGSWGTQVPVCRPGAPDAGSRGGAWHLRAVGSSRVPQRTDPEGPDSTPVTSLQGHTHRAWEGL